MFTYFGFARQKLLKKCPSLTKLFPCFYHHPFKFHQYHYQCYHHYLFIRSWSVVVGLAAWTFTGTATSSGTCSSSQVGAIFNLPKELGKSSKKRTFYGQAGRKVGGGVNAYGQPDRKIFVFFDDFPFENIKNWPSPSDGLVALPRFLGISAKSSRVPGPNHKHNKYKIMLNWTKLKTHF